MPPAAYIGDFCPWEMLSMTRIVIGMSQWVIMFLIILRLWRLFGLSQDGFHVPSVLSWTVLPSDEPWAWSYFIYISSDKIGSRADKFDVEYFTGSCIMKMHPNFREFIAAFKEEPDAYDNFIGMVRSFLNSTFIKYARIYSYFPFRSFLILYSLNKCAYTHIFLLFFRWSAPWERPFSDHRLASKPSQTEMDGIQQVFLETVVYAAILAHPGKSGISRPVSF